MSTQADVAREFLALHRGPTPLLLPNPWDAGSAKILQSLGFRALATTSAGFATSLGRADGAVTGDEAIDHAAAVVAAVDIPVTADLENGFADDPDGVAATIRRAVGAGLAGCSVEDYDGSALYPADVAVDRIRAAAAQAHAGEVHLVLTARAENFLRGNPDLADTIARLQAFQEAGADVLYAPGISDAGDIRALLSAVDRPVNVLAMRTTPSIAELAELGVHRISVGSTFANVAYGALAVAAQELQAGTDGFRDLADSGREAISAAVR